MTKTYDLIIIGTGPAGYTASIYASRYKINQLLIGKEAGGLASEAHKICNFPGEPKITGLELIEKLRNHIKSEKIKEIYDEVIEIKKDKDKFLITTRDNSILNTKYILLAIGTQRRKLNLPDEKKFLGKGLSYCTTCDALFFKNKVVAVIGGSDAANTSSLYLSKIALKVIQIYRKDKLRGDPTWIEQVKNNPKIEIIYNRNIEKLIGENILEYIVLDDNTKIKIDGLFIEIGSVPNLALIKKLKIKTNREGYIIVDNAQRTNIEGIWAAGDITTGSNSFRQIITACSEGAVSIRDIFKTIMKEK